MLKPVKLRYYLAVMHARGFDADATLMGSGIDPGHLNDPAYLVDLKQCQIVVANMIRLTGDQGIGLDVGGQARLADFGIISHAMVSSRTLRQAAGYWVRYSNLVGSLIRISVVEGGKGQWTAMLTGTEQMGFIYNFCVEEMLVAGVKMVDALTGTPAILKEVQLSYPAPMHAARYREYFSCPLHFNAPRCSITILSPAIDSILPSNDEELNQVCEKHCSQVMRQIGGESLIVSQLRSLFLRNAREIPTLQQAAELVGLSPRTLRRRLQEEESSYQNLVNQFRLNLAAEYFKSEHLTPKEVGDLLGYSDTNAFRRALKSWSGQTIGRYREELLDGRKLSGTKAR